MNKTNHNTLSVIEKYKLVNKLRTRLICNDPALAGLLTFIPHHILDEEHSMYNTVAFTDGESIYIGKEFFTFEPPNMCAILLHEAMHIIFRHKHRAANKHKLLFNYCADAIINDTIGYKPTTNTDNSIFILKEKAITLDSLYSKFEVKKTDRSSFNELTTEKLYDLIFNSVEDKLKEKQKGNNSGTSSTQEETGNTKGDNTKGEEKEEKKEKNQAASTEITKEEIMEEIDKILKKRGIEEGQLGEDIKDSNNIPTGSSIEKEANDSSQVVEELSRSIWKKRLDKYRSSSKGNSLIGHVVDDFYTPQVSWVTLLRKYISRHVLPINKISYSKPRRRLSYRIADTGIFIPNKQNIKGLKECVVIIDVSGSCFNSEDFSIFCREIESMQKATKIKVKVLFADVQVTQEVDLKPTDSILELIKSQKLKVEGGGGTDMVVPLEYAVSKYNPFLSIIFTDGYTPFPSSLFLRHHRTLWIINTNVPTPSYMKDIIRIT